MHISRRLRTAVGSTTRFLGTAVVVTLWTEGYERTAQRWSLAWVVGEAC